LAQIRGRTLGPGIALFTDMLTDPAAVNHLTSQIIGAAVRVHRELGPGLLESAYTACLAMEFRSGGLRMESQVAVPIAYHGLRLEIGYRIDMLVEDKVVVEVKAVEALAPIHRAQVLTYLKLKHCPVGLLLNFNVPVLRDGIVRIVNGPLARSMDTTTDQT
jgi:GxxExxY protein